MEKQKMNSRSKWGIVAAIVVALAIVGIAAYYVFARESQAQRAARLDQEDYEELVRDCKKTIKFAEGFEELKKAESLLSQISDYEEENGSAKPDVYCNFAELSKRYKEAVKDLRQSYLDMASKKIVEDNDYRAAYDLYEEAKESLPDDSDLDGLLKGVAANMGYVKVEHVEFSNSDVNGVDIEPAGSDLHADSMRYLFPRITYTSLKDDDSGTTSTIEVFYKIINPDGTLNSSSNSPADFTNKSPMKVIAGESYRSVWLHGWGTQDQSTYEAGTYGFELYFKNRKIYETTFQLLE